MSASSLLKFIDKNKDSNGRRVFWGRAALDGAPFRGDRVPLYKEEEYEQNVYKVYDPKNGEFDVRNPEENAKYLEVLDGVYNGWYHLLYIDRERKSDDGKRLIYIEWLEPYYEDGGRAPAYDVKEGPNEQRNGSTDTEQRST